MLGVWGVVQAWVGHRVTPLTLPLGYHVGTCLDSISDKDQTRPQHITQLNNKHHHHGGGTANPSGGVDSMT